MKDVIERLQNWFKFTAGIGLDLGTVQTRITVPGKKEVIAQPTIVAKNKRSDRIIAIGDDAEHMVGRTPAHIDTIWPIVSGVISDSAAMEAYLSMLLYQKTTGVMQFFGRNMLVAIPAMVTDVEVRIIANTLQQAGARSVSVVPAAVAALLGVGAPVGDPTTQLVVNIGAGITQVAAVAGGSVVSEASSTTAGQQFDVVIADYIKNDFGIRISLTQARKVKHELAAVRGWSDEPGEKMTLSGQDDTSSLPREVSLNRLDVTEAIEPLVTDITDFVREFVGSLSADMIADVTSHGIHLIGGGSNLPGLGDHISDELGITVHGRVTPEKTVIEGVEYILEREDGERFMQPIDSYESTN